MWKKVILSTAALAAVTLTASPALAQETTPVPPVPVSQVVQNVGLRVVECLPDGVVKVEPYGTVTFGDDQLVGLDFAAGESGINGLSGAANLQFPGPPVFAPFPGDTLPIEGRGYGVIPFGTVNVSVLVNSPGVGTTEIDFFVDTGQCAPIHNDGQRPPKPAHPDAPVDPVTTQPTSGGGELPHTGPTESALGLAVCLLLLGLVARKVARD